MSETRRKITVRLTSRYTDDLETTLGTVSETFAQDDIDIHFPDTDEINYLHSPSDRTLETNIINSTQKALDDQNTRQLTLTDPFIEEIGNQPKRKTSNHEWVKELRQAGISIITRLIIDRFTKPSE